MTIRFRNAEIGDAGKLDRIFKTSFCDTFAHLYSPEDLNAFLSGFELGDWQTDLRNADNSFRIAEVDCEAVGYVKLGSKKLPVETDRRSIVLDQLYVLKEHHGSGIAQSLMDWALDEARGRGAEEIYLTVYVDNHRALRFYDRYGFDAVGRFDFMVGNHVDEDIIMRRSL